MLFSRKKKALTPEDVVIPRHVAFIMDGNGRWAKKRALPREAGHVAGAKTFRTLATYLSEIGVEYMTVYAFSTENWKRPQHEIDSIMQLLDQYIDDAEREFADHKASVRFIGDPSPLAPRLREKMKHLEEVTSGRPCRLNIALNYGGRDEIVHAVNTLVAEGVTNVSEDDITSHLYTGDCPPPDLVIRTGGEMRTSNFLLWQSAYAEYYFTDILWPDLTPQDVLAAFDDYSRRHRRYGGL